MGVAYVITAYKYPGQLARLVRRIERDVPGSPILIHVDAKVPQGPFVEACVGTAARFVAQRFRVHWGSFPMVRATLTLAGAALGSGATRVVLLSEQCYPIRPLRDLEALFERSPGIDFIEAVQVRTVWPQGSPRYEKFHFPGWSQEHPLLARGIKGALNKVRPTRRVPHGYEVHAGSTWWALSRDSLEYVLAMHQSDHRLRRFFALTLIPEEMYIHTILANSPRRAALRPALTYARFDFIASQKHPVIWRIDDVPELERSGAYIARKFDETVDSAVMDYFDRRP